MAQFNFAEKSEIEELHIEPTDVMTGDRNKSKYLLYSCASSTQALLGNGFYSKDYLNDYLEEIRQKCTFKKWFFGHYHDNRNVNAEEILLWEQIIRIV